MRSMLVAGLCALTAIAATSFTPAHAFRPSPSTTVSAGPIRGTTGTASSPQTQISNGKAISNCFPSHKIANDFDYCTGTPIIH
jgi:hypothetical protein